MGLLSSSSLLPRPPALWQLLLKHTLLGSALQWQQSLIHQTKTTHVEEQATQNKPPAAFLTGRATKTF